jgi:hypothetical protein
MRTFSIEGGTDSPQVFIDEMNNSIEISGNSTLKETNWFYPNVLRWIVALNNNSTDKKIVNVKLKRVNDSSSKWLATIFQKLNVYYPSTSYEINWYIDGNSSRASDLVRNLQHQEGMKVNLI